MLSTILARLACIGARTNRPRFFTSIHGKGREWLFKYVPGVLVAVSEHQAMYIRGHAPRKDTYCLYSTNAWRTDEPRDRLANEPIRLLSVGHFTGLKGQDTLVDVAEILREEGVAFELTFVGDGPALPGVRDKVHAAGLDEAVSFLGSRTDVRDILARHDILVHLPSYETFGIVCQEALCSGVPVVAARVGGIPEIVPDGCAGSLVDMQTTGAVSTVAREIRRLADPETYRSASAAGLRHVDTFSPESLIGSLIQTYQAK